MNPAAPASTAATRRSGSHERMMPRRCRRSTGQYLHARARVCLTLSTASGRCRDPSWPAWANHGPARGERQPHTAGANRCSVPQLVSAIGAVIDGWNECWPHPLTWTKTAADEILPHTRNRGSGAEH